MISSPHQEPHGVARKRGFSIRLQQHDRNLEFGICVPPLEYGLNLNRVFDNRNLTLAAPLCRPHHSPGSGHVLTRPSNNNQFRHLPFRGQRRRSRFAQHKGRSRWTASRQVAQQQKCRKLRGQVPTCGPLCQNVVRTRFMKNRGRGAAFTRGPAPPPRSRRPALHLTSPSSEPPQRAHSSCVPSSQKELTFSLIFARNTGGKPHATLGLCKRSNLLTCVTSEYRSVLNIDPVIR